MNFDDLNSISEIELEKWDLVTQIIGMPMYLEISSALTVLHNHPELTDEYKETYSKFLDVLEGKSGPEVLFDDWEK